MRFVTLGELRALAAPDEAIVVVDSVALNRIDRVEINSDGDTIVYIERD